MTEEEFVRAMMFGLGSGDRAARADWEYLKNDPQLRKLYDEVLGLVGSDKGFVMSSGVRGAEPARVAKLLGGFVRRGEDVVRDWVGGAIKRSPNRASFEKHFGAAAANVYPAAKVVRPLTNTSASVPVGKRPDPAATAPTQPTVQPATGGPAATRPPDGTRSSPIAAPAPVTAEPATPGAIWKWNPIKEGPDAHEESSIRSQPMPNGWNLIAARVRGKKHKHEGTNCDDWFEIGAAGDWAIVAVSDGAGSKQFSRVGSRAACDAAVKSLGASLEGVRVRTVQELEQDGPVRKSVEVALHQAVAEGHRAIQDAFKGRQGNPEYLVQDRDLSFRELQMNDLSATLLLAVHTVLPDGRSFAMACQIGDGVTAVVGHGGSLVMLGVPDSGGFSGETDFLTDSRLIESAKLADRTYSCLGEIRAMITATDGLTDPYFPSDPGMLRLYADLVLNGVIELPPSAQPVPAPDLNKFSAEVMSAGREGEDVRKVRSAGALAAELNMTINQIVADAGILAAGSQGEPRMCGSHLVPEERLRIWLDSFYVRGEFDDRTLVLVYREAVR